MVARVPRFDGLTAASPRASAAARGASRKSDTRCELALRKALWRDGLRYRKNVASLPGCPDIVFVRDRLAVFCDGDFWHGHDLVGRLTKLDRGRNAPYWVAKIAANVERDRRVERMLNLRGWTVLRFWESEVSKDPGAIARRVARVLREIRHT